jgi:hypothetical protein
MIDHYIKRFRIKLLPSRTVLIRASSGQRLVRSATGDLHVIVREQFDVAVKEEV